MPKPKKSWFEELADDAVNTVTGLVFGDVDDGPPEGKKKNGSRDADDDRDDSDDADDADDGDADDADDDETPAPKKRPSPKKHAAEQVVRFVFDDPGERRPGRPPGSSTKKKPEQPSPKD